MKQDFYSPGYAFLVSAEPSDPRVKIGHRVSAYPVSILQALRILSPEALLFVKLPVLFELYIPRVKIMYSAVWCCISHMS